MINNRLVFIIKDGYMLELQAPETMKLFGRTKKIIKKIKKKLVDNQWYILLGPINLMLIS